MSQFENLRRRNARSSSDFELEVSKSMRFISDLERISLNSGVLGVEDIVDIQHKAGFLRSVLAAAVNYQQGIAFQELYNQQAELKDLVSDLQGKVSKVTSRVFKHSEPNSGHKSRCHRCKSGLHDVKNCDQQRRRPKVEKLSVSILSGDDLTQVQPRCLDFSFEKEKLQATKFSQLTESLDGFNSQPAVEPSVEIVSSLNMRGETWKRGQRQALGGQLPTVRLYSVAHKSTQSDVQPIEKETRAFRHQSQQCNLSRTDKEWKRKVQGCCVAIGDSWSNEMLALVKELPRRYEDVGRVRLSRMMERYLGMLDQFCGPSSE